MESHPEGYRYSQFCERYRRFRKTLNVCMRQTYRAGEKLFVDYAGQTIAVHDKPNGKISKVHLFVAVLGVSNYTYAEAARSEGLEDWITAHVNAFEYFGGVTELLIPDNLKCAVIKPCRYEPELNPTYLDLANHYGTCVIPTRVARPQDKRIVEGRNICVIYLTLTRSQNGQSRTMEIAAAVTSGSMTRLFIGKTGIFLLPRQLQKSLRLLFGAKPASTQTMRKVRRVNTMHVYTLSAHLRILPSKFNSNILLQLPLPTSNF